MPEVQMQPTERFYKFMEQEEGLRLEAYDDKNPNKKLQPGDYVRGTLTIGIGHTGPDVFIGQTITREQAYDLFYKDCKWAVDAVNKLVQVPLTQNQFHALVSFVFNVGVTQFKGSTLLAILNGDRDKNGTFESPPDYDGVPAQLRRWIYSGSEPILRNRREREIELWLERDDNSHR